MICNNCGSNVPEHMNYCPRCGAQFQQAAPPQYQTPATERQKGSGNKGLLVTIIVLVSLLLVIGTAFGIYFMTRDNDSSSADNTAQRTETRVVAQHVPAQTHQPTVSNTPKLSSGIIVDPVDSYVNVRRGPGTSYAIATQLDVGTTVYYERGSKWVKVYDLNNRYLGYVFHDRIR